MFEKLRHKLFGTKFVLVNCAYGTFVRKVREWPSGEKTVCIYGQLILLNEDGCKTCGGQKYFKLT